MRSLGNLITIGKILRDLKYGEDGHTPIPTLQRQTLYRLEKTLDLYSLERRTKGGWRIYSIEEAEEFKTAVRKNYRVESGLLDKVV